MPISDQPFAKIAMVRGVGARGLRAVVEEVLETVACRGSGIVNKQTIRGGEAVDRTMSQPTSPMDDHKLRRFRAGKQSR